MEFHVNDTGSEDGRLPQKPDTSLARARCGVVVRKGPATEKNLGKLFHGLGEWRPTAEAARLVLVEATSPAPGTGTWVASCSNKDQNAFPARNKTNPKPTNHPKQPQHSLTGPCENTI